MKLKLVLGSIIFLAVLAAIIVVSGRYEDIIRTVNGVDRDSQRMSALQSSFSAISKIDSVDAYVRFSQNDISDFLAPSLKKKLKELKIKHINKLEVKDVSIETDSNDINISATLLITPEEHDVKVTAFLSGYIAPSTSEGEIVFFPYIESIKLIKVDRSSVSIFDGSDGESILTLMKRKYGNKFFVGLVNKILDAVSLAVNSLAFQNPISIDISGLIKSDTSLSEMISPKKKKGVRLALSASQKPISPNFDFNSVAFNIDDSGFELLALLDKRKKAQEKEPSENSTTSFKELHSNYSDIFDSKYSAAFSPAKSFESAVRIKKSAIAYLFNSAIESTKIPNQPIVSAIATIYPITESFNGRAQLFEKKSINCESKRKSCQNTSSCAGGSCARDCSRYDLICKTRAEACRVRERTTSEACRVAERVRAETCRAGQDLEVKNCKVKLEGLRFVEDVLDLAEYSVTASATNISGGVNIDSIQLDESISQLLVKGDMIFSAAINAKIHVNPEGIGHIACAWKINPELDMVAQASQLMEIQTSLTQEFIPNSPNFRLNADIQSTPITVTLRPNPYNELLSSPKFLLNCSVLGIAMTGAKIMDFVNVAQFPDALSNIMYGKYIYPSIDIQFTQIFEPLKISSEGYSIFFEPIFENEYVGFSRANNSMQPTPVPLRSTGAAD